MLKPMVQVRSRGTRLVAEFWDCSRLDPAPVRDLDKLMEKHVQGGGRPELIVDMNGVTFAGSTSLGGFLGIQRKCAGQGGRVVFCNVEATVREVFRLSRIENMFLFASDIDDAVGRLDALLGVDAPAPRAAGEPAEKLPEPPRLNLRRRRAPDKPN